MIKDLFKIDEDTFLVDLNKEWISTIPEFKKIISSDRGSKGDADGRKKLHAIKVFTFIYHYCDFQSQFIDYDDNRRREEALHNAGLCEDDVTIVAVEIAIDKYNKLQDTRILRLLNSANGAIDKLTDYFDNIDFELRDINDKLMYSPKEINGLIQSLDKTYSGQKSLEDRVKKELKETARVRGDVKLSAMETPAQMAQYSGDDDDEHEII
jgi:hypothetical protein